MNWINTKDKFSDIPVNINLLITDGYEVYVGFYDSMHEWHLSNGDYCHDVDFSVLYWMEFPSPPNIDD